MTGSRLTRPRSTMLVIATAALAAIGVLGITSSAYAVVHHPKGEFAVFADCPLTNPAVEACLVAKTESGKFTIGKETVPIVNPVVLQGGVKKFFSGTEEEFVGAEDGNTLSKSPQKVPGGLAGLVKCNEISNFLERIACEVVFENGVTGVTATTELAAPASAIKTNVINVLTGTGTGLELPIKVHLENPFLGSECYVGSNAHPIVIDFTTGTTSPPPPNKPITGSPGEFTQNENETIIRIKKNELVNNSFAAPGAAGCGGLFAFLVDPIVDAKLGIPAAAGHNTAVLKGTIEAANSKTVLESE